MRALVTGGAGFIGSHVVDQLLARGYDVRIFDSLEQPTHSLGAPAHLPAAAEFIHGDVRDRVALARALRGADVVVHLAATGGFTPHLARYVECNSLGTANLLELIRDEGLPVQKIVVASSLAVYGEGCYRCPEHGPSRPHVRPIAQLEQGRWDLHCPQCGVPLVSHPTDEEKSVAPGTAYAVSKYDQERLVLNFGALTGIPAVALRYFVTYGPRQSVFNPYTGVCTIFSGRILNQLPIIVYEDGAQTRDFVFVRDVARATAFVLEEPRAAGVFNVGTGVATRIRSLAETLTECWGRSTTIEIPGRYRPGEARHVVADVSRLAALGFRAEVTLAEGLSELVQWLAAEALELDHFSRAESYLQATGVVRSTS